ncbi:hypothetical protein FSP39_018222 [Pinctada imbricata]|uniref:Uncharacterized protein n=1 Tax=Pinctada imbricata TaxID=66713 RepID=A0AA88YIS3_PINIB|nr:hypothetical protein FSP39_018222 [Pinctada imbricata]
MFEFKDAKKSNEDTVPPRFTQPAVPKFRSGKLNAIALDEIYGYLTLNGGGNNSDYVNTNGPAFATTHDHLKKAMSLPKNYSRRITSEEELSVLQTGRSQPSTIVCVGLGQAWISTSNDTLKLVDKSSNFEEKTVTHKSFCDAGMTPFNEIVLLDSNAKAVLLLTAN